MNISVTDNLKFAPSARGVKTEQAIHPRENKNVSLIKQNKSSAQGLRSWESFISAKGLGTQCYLDEQDMHYLRFDALMCCTIPSNI